MMSRVLAVIFMVSCAAPAGFFSPVLPGRCIGQSVSPQDIDYEPLAVDSVLDIAQEAAKLPDIEQKVTLLISVAKLLPASRHEDALRLLDTALGALKDLAGSERADWGLRHKAATLRSEVLSAYAKLDSKKVLAMQKESAPEDDSSTSQGDKTVSPLRNGDWRANMLDQNQRAGEAAKIALSILDSDFERASALVVKSVEGGAVSSELFNIFQKLNQSGSRVLLNKLESRIGETLARTVTLEYARNSTPEEILNGLELASEAINRISDAGLKTTLDDFVAITRVNLLAKEKKFNDAQRLAESIPTTEMRAWTMLALASTIRKEDRIRALGLISSTIKTLDAASPSPRKVELALLAVAMLVKDDPQRAFEVLSVAAKYENSSPLKVERANDDLSSALRLEVSVGSMSTMLSRVPESLGEIEIDRSLSLLGKADWFRSQQMVGEFHEKELQLLLKLKLAEGILEHSSKQKKGAAQKPL
jgi:hypothetical protein